MKRVYQIVSLILYLAVTLTEASAGTTPKIECLVVAPNGDVTITWDVFTGTGFVSYDLYTANAVKGPYSKLFTSSTISANSYTHAGTAANTQQVFYYLEIKTSSGSSLYSDSLQTIFLKLTNSGTGIANLKWNSLDLHNATNTWYRVYREYPVGIWVLLDSTQNLNYKDTANVCNAQINYKIEVLNTAATCSSVSSISGSIFQDKISPAIPEIDSVSIDANGKAIIGWKPGKSKDTKGYIILINKGGWVPIDTVLGINTTNYTNPGSNANSGSEEYRIIAIDSCGNVSPMPNTQNTLFLTGQIDKCKAANNINWNSYQNMHPSLTGYRIFVSENGQPYSLLAVTDSASSSYTHTQLTALNNYCYRIQAYNSDSTITSASNTVCITASFPKLPGFSYLRYVTVPNNNQVDLAAHVDSTVFVTRYDIERADSPTGPFAIIGNVVTKKSDFTFTDNTAKPGTHSYSYRIATIDSCGNPVLYSNISTTIFLAVTANKSANGDISNSLVWSPYQSWPGNVNHYNVFRAIDGVFDPTPIASNLPSNTASYTDDVTYVLNGKGVFSYYVMGYEPLGSNPYTFADSSKSNIADARQNALIFIPNAFCPNGINKVFKPSLVYVDTEEYEMTIFDRWGHKVFATTDPAEGWDGSSAGGKLGEQGVYVYYIIAKTALGEYLERSGSVTLIR